MPTYQICNLIFFPLSSTVLILKSTPVNKTDEDEAKTMQFVRKIILLVCFYAIIRKTKKKLITLNPKRREQKFASMCNDLSVLPGTTEEPRYVRFYPELEMQHCYS